MRRQPTAGAALALGAGLALQMLAAPAARAQPADGQWAELPPPSRLWHTAVYDAARQRMIVCGGAGTNVWTLPLDGSGAWTVLPTSGATPPAFTRHVAIYDPVRDRVVVYGGFDRATRANVDSVWALSLAGTPQWTEIPAAGPSPGPREAACAIYDPVRDRMVMFGGALRGSASEVWALSLAGVPTWTQLEPGGTLPAGRSEAAAVYDPDRDRMLVLGGDLWPTAKAPDTLWALSLADTLEWSAHVPAGPAPTPRRGLALVYDPARHELVMFGGSKGYDYLLDPSPQGTWRLTLGDPPTWSLVNLGAQLPWNLTWPTAVYDPPRRRVVLYGGTNGLDARSETWTLDLDDPYAWFPMPLPGHTPRARDGPAAIYDTYLDRMLVFGGGTPYTMQLRPGDVADWTLVGTAGAVPDSGARGPIGMYDEARQRLIVLDEHLNAWALPLLGDSAWAMLAPSGTQPPRRVGHHAVFDSHRGRVIVCGGVFPAASGPDTPATDVWELDLGDCLCWRQILPAGPPPPERDGSVALYDPIGDRVLVWAGRVSSYPPSGSSSDTVWALSLGGRPAWSPLVPAGVAPPTLAYATAVFDPVRGRALLFGGYTPGAYSDACWALSLAGPPAWTQLSPSGARPLPRSGHVSVYDPLRDRMVVLGGWGDYGGDLNDTWVLSLDGSEPGLFPAVAASGAGGRAALTWSLGAPGAVAAVERRREGGPWGAVAEVTAGVDGRASYLDTHVSGGFRYGYRLRVADRLGESTWISVAAGPGLWARVFPNPSRCRISLSYSLPGSGPARLDLFDVRGRRLVVVPLADHSAGRHVVELEEDPQMIPGVYLLRLTQGAQAVTTKVALLR